MQIGNQADYARHREVSRKTVTEWKQRGLLRFTADGDVDFDASDQALRDHGLLDADEAAKLDGLWSMAEAERIKENYAARIKRMEYERESAAVAEIGDVVAAIVSEFAIVRRRLSRIGVDLAPKLAGMRDASLIKAAIDAEVIAALTELSAEDAEASTIEAARAAVAERFGQ
jgi:hypothetical protein